MNATWSTQDSHCLSSCYLFACKELIIHKCYYNGVFWVVNCVIFYWIAAVLEGG